MEERQDKSALGWGKEEQKKETETKWWKVWDTKVWAAVLFHRIHKVWNKYSVCLDIVSSPSINKIYHVINWTEITNWATWNSPSSTVCPAQTHNSVFCDSESCAPVLFQIPQITKFVKQQMCWRKYSQEVFVLLSGQGPQVATRSVSYFLKLFRTMNNTLND